MPLHKQLTLIFLLFFVQACSQKTKDVIATVDEAVFGFSDVVKSKQELNAINYANSYLKINDNHQVLIVLALTEPSPQNPTQTQLKWLSADRAMLTTENGRLVKTLRLLNNNISGLTADNSIDPLTIKGKKPEHHEWQAVYDWQPNYRYNYRANLTWNYIASESIHSTIWDKETDYYQEHVSIPSINAEFTNHFWLDKTSHEVVKSIQYLGPDMASVEMTILKPFTR
jgi:hypothetical protein